MEDRIFRKYDIRGIFGKDLNPEIAEHIGRAFALYLMEQRLGEGLKVSIGRDVRMSSDALRDAVIRGVISSGIDVVDIGECPTPLQYFSLYHLNVDGGIMITGSHNPPEYNGFKLSVGKETIYGDEIQELRKIIERGRDQSQQTRGEEGRLEHYEIIPAYLGHLIGQFSEPEKKGDISNPIRVVIDAGNGTAGLVAPELFKKLGYEVVELYTTPDGRFPNHHPDPTLEENLKDLIDMVKEKRADIGVAYDGDGDRIGVVDEVGNIVWGDKLMIVFARDILHHRKEGATFIGEVKCSQVMYDEIERLGGKAIMWKTGHSLIKAKMREVGAILAGEMSGHIFFADRYFGYDDAIYATCRLLEIMSKGRSRMQRGGLSALLTDIPKTVSTPEIRIDCSDEEKFEVVERLSGMIKTGEEDLSIRDVIRIDGLRVVFEEGWALIRASNTQPVLVMRFEASTEGALKRIQDFIKERLEMVKVQMLRQK
ncbi:MAG: phosphomannomutase/phosphoglucomutase, partial [Thermodesulfobacteriota bacterium]